MSKIGLRTPVLSGVHVLRLTLPFFLINTLLLFSVVGDNSYAQSITTDGTMGTNVQVDNGNYVISEGTSRGTNLLHSFGKFNVDTNESATFTGPDSIHNIIGRVTGGTQSWIDGLLRSTIDGANLFLLNPAGVLFGPNASLDLNGAFHVSTADYLRFDNGDKFYVNPSGNSVLSVASPAAFGFLSENPAGITIQQSNLAVPEGETVSLIGGDIEIVGSGALDEIVAPSGRINIASVASAGEIYFNCTEETPNLKMESFNNLGNIDISQDAFIDARGNPGGNIIVRGGNFFLTESIITAASQGDLDHPGIGVDIKITKDMILTAGELGVAEISTSSFGAGKAGNLRVEAGNLKMTGDPKSYYIADIASRVFSSGDSGDIFVKTGRLKMNEYSGILAQVFGSGTGGDITLETDSLIIDGGKTLAFISNSTFNSGDAGDLNVNAKDVTFYGGAGGFTGLASQVSSWAFDEATAGNLTVTTEKLQLLDGAQINAGIFAGAGQAGDIEVVADNILISGKDPYGDSSGIYSNVDGQNTTGPGGDILITTNNLQMNASGKIATYSASPGDSGNIKIKSGNLALSDGAFLSSTNYGTGEAGNINIAADSILLAGPSPQDGFTGLVALGEVFATGAGDIKVNTSSLEILDGAQISTRTNGPGDGGNIDIIANDVRIGGVDSGSASLDGPSSGIFSSSLAYLDFAEQATGEAGDISVQANNMNLFDQATISASSTSLGNGGEINIFANNILNTDRSFITTASEKTKGGDISITTPEVRLINQSVVSAKSSGGGNAGDINITATDIFWMEDSAVTTESTQADGGNIKINTEDMVNLWDSEITASVGGGRDTVGGNINIDPQFVTLSNSKVIANAFEGRGGNIQISTDVFISDLDSVVDASSQMGIDGIVDILAATKVVGQSLKPLSEKYKSAVALLRESCTARAAGGKYSSFVVSGRDALPIEPGGLLPSPISQ